LMQGLADGYFILPYTIANFIAGTKQPKVSSSDAVFSDAKKQVQERIHKLFSIKGKKTPLEFHRELGKLTWDDVGMSRTGPGLESVIKKIQNLKEDFAQNLLLPGDAGNLNPTLEHAGRVADFIELGELMARDALDRKESCGCHFREEYQTPENEAQRDDANHSHVAVWFYQGEGKTPELQKEALNFEYVKPTQRNYK